MKAIQSNREWIDRLVSNSSTSLPGNKYPWLDSARQQARTNLHTYDVPNRKLEAWRYTSIENLLKQPFEYNEQRFEALLDTDIDDWILNETDSYRLVFVNGRCIPWLSNIEALASHIKIGSLRASLLTDPEIIEKYLTKHPAQISSDIFVSLNTAYINDGLFVHIPTEVQLDKPIEVYYISTAQEEATLVLPRNLVVLERGASATLIEHYCSTGNSVYFNNNVTEMYVNDNAQLMHYRVQDESEQAHHLGRIKLLLGTDSQYHSAHFSLGASWSRCDIDVAYSGTGAGCYLNGLYVVKDGQLSDFHVNVVHSHSHCVSRENFRGILAGKGRAVFDGRVVVEKNAQKTDAHLSNNNLLLSRDAEVDTKPQLEIEADDVKCGHGTTVGQIDPNQVFYLRSRGIDMDTAKRMLCLGFTGEILDLVALEEVRSFLASRVGHQLQFTAPLGHLA